MAAVAIEFDKSLQDRLDEYKEIFLLSSEVGDESFICTDQKRVRTYQMKDFWRNHLSVVLYHKGWKAIWKVPIDKCIMLNIKYPSNVLVEIISIVWDTLCADVQVLKINDVNVPSSRRVAALNEIFPIEQQATDFDPWLIADELDKYRFFYEYLWYPWDEFEDDISSWSESHLEMRLQLLYDMVTGEVNAEDSERIRHLISDARHVQAESEETEAILDELKSELEKPDDYYSDLENLEALSAQISRMDVQDKDEERRKQKEKEEMLIVHLLDLQRGMENIRHEVEALEDPFLRKAMANVKLRRHRSEFLMNTNDLFSINTYESKMKAMAVMNVALVCGKSSIEKMRTYLDFMESKFSKDVKCEIGIFPNLQIAVDEANSNRTSFVVCSGIHRLRHTEELLSPGTTVTGFSEDLKLNPSVIVGQSLGKVMIVVDWRYDKISSEENQNSANLENLHFDPHGIEAVLLVDQGAVNVNNCYFGHEEAHGDGPLIGGFSTPSTSVLQTYSHRLSICKVMQHGCGDGWSNSLPYLPMSTAFDCSLQRGIAVGACGKLDANDCHFEGLHLGIIAYSGAKVTLKKCRFSRCRVGIRISKGAEVVAEECIFDHSIENSIQICIGTHEEQDPEIKKMMEGREEVITSNHMLQRIPGISFKECVFLSNDCCDVRLSSLSEIVNFPNSQDGFNILNKNQSIGANEVKMEESDVILIGDSDTSADDSIIILSNNN